MIFVNSKTEQTALIQSCFFMATLYRIAGRRGLMKTNTR
nr:MAG TPA: hypothetical protein [Caudoviricetes sp.]